MNFILIAILVLGTIALIAAVVLYIISKKFAVEEDPRLPKVVEALPGANCGGCGFAGCSALADALVKGADKGTIEGLLCPVGGQPVMDKVAGLLGMTIQKTQPMVAVVRCNGTCEFRTRIAEYGGLRTCSAMHATGAGETACGYGCLGCGDCVEACQFDAIHINKTTQLPEVDSNKCTACNACVKACPRNIIELRKKGIKDRRIYVRCVNKEKGAISIKACKVSCIACGKCAKVCQFEAITIENNLSYIDFNKCKLCKKCVEACPTHAIVAINFPIKKIATKSEHIITKQKEEEEENTLQEKQSKIQEEAAK